MMEQRRRETLSFVCQGNVVITTSLKPRLNPLAANNQLNNDSWLHVEVGFNRATCMVILSVDKEGKANWKKRKSCSPKDGDYAKDRVYSECPAEYTFLVQ